MEPRKRSALLPVHEGRRFENQFIVACMQNETSITRIPDGCKQVSAKRLVRVKTPFDWVISSAGRTALIDTKSMAGKTFPASSIDGNQLKQLHAHAAHGAVEAGYVIWFRELDQVIFVSTEDLWRLYNSPRGSSLKWEDVHLFTQLGASATMDPRRIF